MRTILPLLGLVLATAASAQEAPYQDPAPVERFRLLCQFEVPGDSAEIVCARPDGRVLVYTDGKASELGIIDLEDPSAPSVVARVPVPGEPTSVSFLGDIAVATVQIDLRSVGHARPGTKPGKLLVLDLSKPQSPGLIGTIDIGHHPDCVKLCRVGRDSVAVIAVENEPEIVVDGVVIDDDRVGHPGDQSPPGRILVVTLDHSDLSKSTVCDIELPVEAMREAGMLFPNDAQPEYVAVHGTVAAVTLQENNGVALVDISDPRRPRLTRLFSTGIAASRAADLREDGEVRFVDRYPSDADGEHLPLPIDAGGHPVPAGARMPDALAFTYDGTILFTADEGELDYTGGRGFSAWSLTGELLWQDGGTLESAAHAKGLYPDKRSDAKGIEVEGIAIDRFGANDFAFVLSERGSFMAVYDLADPTRPILRQILPTGIAPEGIVTIPARNLVIAANEVDGTLSIFAGGPATAGGD